MRTDISSSCHGVTNKGTARTITPNLCPTKLRNLHFCPIKTIYSQHILDIANGFFTWMKYDQRRPSISGGHAKKV